MWKRGVALRNGTRRRLCAKSLAVNSNTPLSSCISRVSGFAAFSGHANELRAQMRRYNQEDQVRTGQVGNGRVALSVTSDAHIDFVWPRFIFGCCRDHVSPVLNWL